MKDIDPELKVLIIIAVCAFIALFVTLAIGLIYVNGGLNFSI